MESGLRRERTTAAVGPVDPGGFPALVAAGPAALRSLLVRGARDRLAGGRARGCLSRDRSGGEPAGLHELRCRAVGAAVRSRFFDHNGPAGACSSDEDFGVGGDGMGWLGAAGFPFYVLAFHAGELY